jgi:hypothetical protein
VHSSETQQTEAQPPGSAPLGLSALRRVAALRATRVTDPVLQGLTAYVLYLVVFVTGFGLPLIRHLNVPNLRQYWTDEQFYAWSLGWWPWAVSHWTNPLFSAQIGAPHGYALAWASTTPAVDLAMWPVTAAFGVVVSYNVMLLIIPPVAAWAAFVAARRLTGRFWASLLAGAVYGFCPFELIHSWQGQPNLTMIALFPLMIYLVLRWWDGSLSARWFVALLGLAMAVEFYVFNEAFLEMTMVLAGSLLIGFAAAGRAAWRRVARLAGLGLLAYTVAVLLASPYLLYSLRHYQGAVTRQEPAFSLPLIRLVVPTSQQMFGVTPLIHYSGELGRTGIENYVGLPLLVILLATALLAWRSRLSWLLVAAFVFVIALAAGPALILTSIRHTYRLPWAGLWSLPIARSAEPSRFIVFGVLILAIALARWLSMPSGSALLRAGRWVLGLLAVAAVITDAPTAYQSINPLPAGLRPPLPAHASNQLPAFITDGMYRKYLKPGEIVAILTFRGNAGMLFQAASGFYFRIAGGYINASLTPVNALPHPITLLADPSDSAMLTFDAYARSSRLGALLVEQAWETPWMTKLPKLGLRGISAGGVTIYPIAPFLAEQDRVHAANRAHAVASSPPERKRPR